MRYVKSVTTWICACSVAAALAGSAAIAEAQEPTSRAEAIEQQRHDKNATLWPEREAPLVARANHLLDRGLIEGLRSGKGPNGWHLVLSGTRPAQGQSFGAGYRRSDLFRDRLTADVSVAGTARGALLVETTGRLNSARRAEGTFIDFRGAYERSPRMEFYGLGPDSLKENRTGYRLETLTADTRAGYRFTRHANAGVDFLVGKAETGPVARDDIPSIETVFDATTAPGLFDDATFYMWGAFLGWDNRDLPSGPKEGGFYGVSLHRYTDVTNGKYSHRRLGVEMQQFFPYFNDTRVLAFFLRGRFAFAGSDDQVVPFYLQPKLGGSFELRGYNQYRFHDNNAIQVAVEHRWYAFTGLEMALFADAGKTVPQKGQVSLSNLKYSGGIGFRGRVQDAIVLRFDVARSEEGWRWIWSLSDISRRLF
jgi:outer membrane protein assembly factor BamA